MQSKPMLMTLVLATLLAVSGLAGAADKSPGKDAAQGMPGMEKKGMDHGRMQGGMMQGEMMQGGGMMGMMNSCKHMMGGSMMPQLPAGNEKLQLQMQAEIMQKTGEIIAKYADKIKDETKSAP